MAGAHQVVKVLADVVFGERWNRGQIVKVLDAFRLEADVLEALAIERDGLSGMDQNWFEKLELPGVELFAWQP